MFLENCMDLFEACTYLSDLTRLSVVVLKDEETVSSFCSFHYFHSSQKSLTPEGFSLLLEHLTDRNILSFRDTLRMHMILFRIKDMPVVIGPFCVDDLTDTAVELLKRRYNIKHLPVMEYRAYRTRYPMEAEQKVLHAARTLIAHVESEWKERTLETVNDELPRSPQGWEYTKENFETLVNERYKAETEMMDYVSRGETRNAIDKYRYLHNNVRFMSKIGGTIEGSRISAGITRTTIRVAAMNAGLPPVLLDQLTGESSRIIRDCESRDAMAKENERMIRVICEAVHRWRSEQYSPSTFTAVSQLERQFPDEISVEKIADHLGLSTAHFIRTFKKETGMTPNAYLMKVRVKEAAKLLRSTQYSIQEISTMVGIPDANYFVKCFRKYYDMTPRQYRLGDRKKEPEP